MMAFLMGILMMGSGLYLMLNSIHTTQSFTLSYGLYHWRGYTATTGMIMVPFMLGIGWLFFSPKAWGGWLLTIASLAAFILGVITSVHFRLRTMTAFDLILIIVLMVGGIGLMLRSLRRTA